ncbi:HEPN domain-containing protein [Streptomyces lichenis]|uniref:HEPN domain-containing protein n=1 Tax=Streptomyces lichenis TaxID=2306967 RepID=A0ABT0I512_9ACTN|nr:HEPN domain-containing protein [Streptomyces lichenis]MCK8676408.1 HEPN domain-containing protein [Streptomyces lichenis]
MYEDQKSVLDYLGSTNQVSHHATLQATLPKVLLLAAASEFESRVCDVIREHVRANSGDLKILELVDQKAIKRQYHTLFDWDKRNAGKFWSLFGADFKRQMAETCRRRPRFESSIAAFLEMGSLRNQLVHNNYAAFSLDKTLADVFSLYQEAEGFVNSLPVVLHVEFTEGKLDKILPE